MSNLEYYQTKEIAEIGYEDYPFWGMNFDEWLNSEHQFQMPPLYGKSGYPYYTISYDKAKEIAENRKTK